MRGIGRHRKMREEAAKAQGTSSGLPTPLPDAPPVPLSLPPAATEPAQVSSVSKYRKKKLADLQDDGTVEHPWGFGPQPNWWLPEDSKIKKIAQLIVAMRLSGHESSEIAKTFGLTQGTLNHYVYRAGKMGWLNIDNAKAAVEYELLPKVIRNLHQGLDSTAILNTGMRESNAMALKIAEGTIFKDFDPQGPLQQQQTVVAIKIEMPQGPQQQVREGTLGGTPAFVEGDAHVVSE